MTSLAFNTFTPPCDCLCLCVPASLQYRMMLKSCPNDKNVAVKSECDNEMNDGD